VDLRTCQAARHLAGPAWLRRLAGWPGASEVLACKDGSCKVMGPAY